MEKMVRIAYSDGMRRLSYSLLPVFAAGAGFAAEPPKNAEIEALIAAVEKSDAKFIRDGTEYSGDKAAAHLRLKLSRAGNKVKTAEDFITGIASKSSLSGKPYQLRLPNGKTVPASEWFAAELAKRRAGGA